MKFKTYTTERLILRRLTPEDFIYVFEHYSDTEIKDFLGLTSDEEFLKELNKFENGYTTYNRSIEFFQIIDKETKRVIGGCGFHNWYLDHNRAELGYAITNEVYRGLGVMTEALKVVIEHGFTKMKLHRIEALVGTTNTPSLKLMEKFAFKQEGVLKQHYFINNEYQDSMVFGLLSRNM